MRSKWYFLMVGLALVLAAVAASSQFGPPAGGGGGAGGFGGMGGGGRGNRGGGGGGMGAMGGDPTQFWNMISGGKETITRDDITNPMMQGMFDRMVQNMGVTNGQLSRDQFTTYMQQRQANRGNPGGPTGPDQTPGAPVVAMPGGNTQGGFGRGGNNPFGGGNNPFGGGNNAWGGGGNNPFGGMGGGGTFNPDVMAEARFRRMDLDGDGLLSYDELAGDPALQAEKDRWDTDNDGFINLAEFKEYFKARIAQFQLPGGPTDPNASPDERKVTVYRVGKYPPGLPAWFAQYDTDRDGQVGLYEWKTAGQPIAQFEKMDLNGDGFLTVEEVLKATGVTVASANGGSPGFPGMNGFGQNGRGGMGGMGGRGNRGMGGGGNNPFGGMGGGNNPFGGGNNPFGGGNNPFGGNNGGGGRGGRGGRGGGGGGNNPFGGGMAPGADPNAQGGGGRGGRGGFGGGNNPFGGGGAASGTDPNAQNPGGGRGRGGFGGGGNNPFGGGGAAPGTDPNAQNPGGGGRRGRGGNGGGAGQ